MIDLHGDGVEISTYLVSLNEFVLFRKLLRPGFLVDVSTQLIVRIPTLQLQPTPEIFGHAAWRPMNNLWAGFWPQENIFKWSPNAVSEGAWSPGDKLIMMGHGKGAFFPGMVWEPCIPSIQH